MNWEKVIKKGLEGGVITGGTSAAVTQDAISTIIGAGVGFLLGALKNWMKHKND